MRSPLIPLSRRLLVRAALRAFAPCLLALAAVAVTVACRGGTMRARPLPEPAPAPADVAWQPEPAALGDGSPDGAMPPPLPTGPSIAPLPPAPPLPDATATSPTSPFLPGVDQPLAVPPLPQGSPSGEPTYTGPAGSPPPPPPPPAWSPSRDRKVVTDGSGRTVAEGPVDQPVTALPVEAPPETAAVPAESSPVPEGATPASEPRLSGP